MAAHNHAIEADIIELKSGDQTLEEQARYELDMVKEDEVFINLLINGFYKEQKEYVLS